MAFPGFNLYFDVTYPFTAQTVLAEDQWVQPFMYQLNTLHMWQDTEANPRNNILWVGERTKLFDCVEDGQLKGINEDAFKCLLRFVLQNTGDRGVNLRPYLSEENSPQNKEYHINFKGQPAEEEPKIGRFQYPPNAIYF